MNQNYFVEVLRKVVVDQSVNDMLLNLDKPPGSKPTEDILKQSKFYLGLSNDQKIDLKSVLNETAEMTLFGLLCVLDGVRAIEEHGEKGSLELWYRKGDFTHLINDPDKEFLHDLFL